MEVTRQEANPEPRLITVWVAMVELGKSRATIYSMCTRGILQFHRGKGSTLILSDSLRNAETVRRGRPPGSKTKRSPPGSRLVARLVAAGKLSLAAELERAVASLR